MTALQLIPSRQLNITTAPSVITISSISWRRARGRIRLGSYYDGTIRTFDVDVRRITPSRLQRTVTAIAPKVLVPVLKSLSTPMHPRHL